MKIAFTGASSTGKTSLLKKLLTVPAFVNAVGAVCTADARSLLRAMGHHHMDNMSRDELRDFQLKYFAKKRDLENQLESFVTDRSFVDVAAFWVERDTFDRSQEEQNYLVQPCQKLSSRYTFHVFFPFGMIPFEPDGYRPEDFSLHWKVDRRIQVFLKEWGLPCIVLDTPDIEERVARVMCCIQEHLDV